MLVKDFLNTIKEYGDLPLLFQYRNDAVVQGGYHVTEIKNATFDTIDCGNSLHSWKEVVVQVWVPEGASPSDAMMPASKFLKIWDVVDRRLNLYQEAEIRIEYGDSSYLTANYHIDSLRVTEDGLVVEMAPPRTMCKPREILVPFADEAVLAEVVNGEPIRLEMVSPLPGSESVSSSSCCAPAPAASASSCCAPASASATKQTSSCC